MEVIMKTTRSIISPSPKSSPTRGEEENGTPELGSM